MAMELLIGAVADLVNTTDKQLADGFQITDAFAFIPVLSQIPTVLAQKQAIGEEWKNRTPETLQSWVAQAKEKIDIKNDKTERKIEKGLALAAAAVDLIGEFTGNDETETPA